MTNYKLDLLDEAIGNFNEVLKLDDSNKDALNNIAKYNVFLKPEDMWIREKFNLDGQLEERHEYNYLSNVLTDETIYQYDLS